MGNTNGNITCLHTPEVTCSVLHYKVGGENAYILSSFHLEQGRFLSFLWEGLRKMQHNNPLWLWSMMTLLLLLRSLGESVLDATPYRERATAWIHQNAIQATGIELRLGREARRTSTVSGAFCVFSSLIGGNFKMVCSIRFTGICFIFLLCLNILLSGFPKFAFMCS